MNDKNTLQNEIKQKLSAATGADQSMGGNSANLIASFDQFIPGISTLIGDIEVLTARPFGIEVEVESNEGASVIKVGAYARGNVSLSLEYYGGAQGSGYAPGMLSAAWGGLSTGSLRSTLPWVATFDDCYEEFDTFETAAEWIRETIKSAIA